MAGRGRPPGFVMSEEHRTKIANSQILKRLIDFASGKAGVEMSATQATVALGLLRKVMPDLQSVDLNANGSLTVYLAKPDESFT